MDTRRLSLLIQPALVVRWIALLSLAVWFGGFTFYSAVVIPVLHDRLGGLDSGSITGEVSDTLNAVGVGTVVWWWGMIWTERSEGSRAARRVRASLMAVTTAILAGLLGLHGVLDRHLEAGSLRGFYPLHRVYLIASTVQWAVNLALFGSALWVWKGAERKDPVDV